MAEVQGWPLGCGVGTLGTDAIRIPGGSSRAAWPKAPGGSCEEGVVPEVDQKRQSCLRGGPAGPSPQVCTVPGLPRATEMWHCRCWRQVPGTTVGCVYVHVCMSV